MPGPDRRYSRVEADRLVRYSYALPTISPNNVRISVDIISSAIAGILCYVAAIEISWLTLFVFAPAGCYLISSAHHGANWQRFTLLIHDHFIGPKLRLRAVIDDPARPPGSTITVEAETWLCREKDYISYRTEYRKTHGRSAWPAVPYRLVIATYFENESDRMVALSGAGNEVWDRRNKVYKFDLAVLRDPYDASYEQEIAGVASALEDVISFLHERGKAARTTDVISMLGQERGYYLSVALKAATIWGLVDVVSMESSNLHEASELLVELADVGRTWHMASERFQSMRAKERRKMNERRQKPTSIKFTGPVTAGNFTVAGHDISDQHNYSTQPTASSDQELIASFAELLNIREIPWETSALAGVRLVLEDAVERQNPRVTGVDRAIAKLKSVCGDVLVGMLSIGSYSLLMEHFR